MAKRSVRIPTVDNCMIWKFATDEKEQVWFSIRTTLVRIYLKQFILRFIDVNSESLGGKL